MGVTPRDGLLIQRVPDAGSLNQRIARVSGESGQLVDDRRVDYISRNAAFTLEFAADQGSKV